MLENYVNAAIYGQLLKWFIFYMNQNKVCFICSRKMYIVFIHDFVDIVRDEIRVEIVECNIFKIARLDAHISLATTKITESYE